MATISSALNTPFTPSAGDFIVQCSAGVASLERSNDNDAPFVHVGTITSNDANIVANPVAGARYQFVQVGATTAVVQADQ